MHYWGDEWFEQHGEKLQAAQDFIKMEARLRAGLHLHMKEKYGTLRFEFTYSSFYPGSWPISSALFPGHLFYRLPKEFQKDEKAILELMEERDVPRRLGEWQMQILDQIMAEACDLYPEIAVEIMEDYNLTFDKDHYV